MDLSLPPGTGMGVFSGQTYTGTAEIAPNGVFILKYGR